MIYKEDKFFFSSPVTTANFPRSFLDIMKFISKKCKKSSKEIKILFVEFDIYKKAYQLIKFCLSQCLFSYQVLEIGLMKIIKCVLNLHKC